MEKRIALFCSSYEEIDPAFHEAARQLTCALCGKGYTIVSGGSWRGTMGVIADEAVRCGGRHVGVVPRFMAKYAYEGLTELVWTDTMAERKGVLRKDAVAVIALPGGIGTLDELIETHVLSKLGQFSGKLFALNIKGFYEPLKDLFRHYIETGMLKAEDCSRVVFADTVEEVLAQL